MVISIIGMVTGFLSMCYCLYTNNDFWGIGLFTGSFCLMNAIFYVMEKKKKERINEILSLIGKNVSFMYENQKLTGKVEFVECSSLKVWVMVEPESKEYYVLKRNKVTLLKEEKEG